MSVKVQTKEDIISRIFENRSSITQLGVVSIGIFGSFVRCEQTSDSDIDILVEFLPEEHTFDNFMDLSFFLESLLGRKVELVTLEALSPHIGPHILKEVESVPFAA